MAPLILERPVWAGNGYPAGGVLDGRKTEFFIHHTASPNQRLWTKAQERAFMRALWKQHVEIKGWSDIGYNYVQFPSSRIYRGRPANRVPAAQELHNTGTRAIVVVGTNPIMEVFQRRKLRKLIRALKDEQGFRVLGGHREVVATECPGDRVMRWITKWRREFKLSRP